MTKLAYRIANGLETLSIRIADWLNSLFKKDSPMYLISAGMLSYYELEE